jgi:hypothetical protein
VQGRALCAVRYGWTSDNKCRSTRTARLQPNFTQASGETETVEGRLNQLHVFTSRSSQPSSVVIILIYRIQSNERLPVPSTSRRARDVNPLANSRSGRLVAIPVGHIAFTRVKQRTCERQITWIRVTKSSGGHRGTRIFTSQRPCVAMMGRPQARRGGVFGSPSLVEITF